MPQNKEANKTNSESKTFDKYTLLLHMEKTRLHARYIVIICVAICVWSLVTGTAHKDIFVSQISFASTVTSIILSVIAIIISITGESKTTMMKAQMEDTAHQLETTVEKITQISETTEDNLNMLKQSVSQLEVKIGELPESIAKETMHRISKQEDIGGINIGWTKREE